MRTGTAVQITNDYPAGPSIDEMLPTLQYIQERGCLILRKFTLDQLERVIGRLTVELEAAKKVSSWHRSR